MDHIFTKAQKDSQSITAEWIPINSDFIEGVQVREVKNVLKNNGLLTEIYRDDWEIDNHKVGQVFQVLLYPGGLSAWHAHQHTTDRLFVSHGVIKIVLYDGREDSPTYGHINEFRAGSLRPLLITVPPKVWHGVYNYGNVEASLLNIVDEPYKYSDPDHWRIPSDSPEIPYRFF
jgi:dTDP-4-dehydrorhamnose 3,5-epimerase